MEIKNQTPMTLAVLKEFNRQHQRALRIIMTVMWAVLGAALCIIFLLGLLLGTVSLITTRTFPNADLLIIGGVGIVLCVLRLFIMPALARRNMRKQADQHCVNTFCFTRDIMEDHSVSDTASSQSQIQYTAITKVTESKNAFYLYISPTAAHIVRKDGFTEGTEEDFRLLLHTVIDPKKLHIQ